MGSSCCSSSNKQNEADTATNEIDTELDRVQEIDDVTYKLLLLGAGSSGKSTILKQITELHVKDSKSNEGLLLESLPYLLINLVNNMKHLIEYCNRLYKDKQIEECKISEDSQKIIDKLNEDIFGNVKASKVYFDEELCKQFHILLKDPAIKTCYDKYDHLCPALTDNFRLLFGNMDRYAKDDFIPTFEDYILIRRRTTGINKVVCCFNNPKNNELKDKFVIYDVGGQRTERKKWLSLFDDVKAIMFVCAISSFDQSLFEDERENRLEESFRVFSKYINNQSFDTTHVILLLNKYDMFEKKIESRQLQFNKYFPNYKGKNTCKEIIEYVQKQFMNNMENKSKSIFVQICTAVDQNNIGQVFEKVRIWIVHDNFQDVGFL